ncbi:NADP-dependent oxidoreductase domain-containing protein [Jimgerdemannia flammicorona]|uniref:NADP-dependent oxidoreductase domain-containing protein n=1 Tax=Jimgerdemannia flammicorona TaxID=994334 RepID=A0A433DBN6_9FUNG|nr:NADP-dependent oxidoreductase domain-containing protein [Jimgerdemannia flammicorona]
MLNLTRLSSSCPAASSTPGLTRRFLASHPHHTATNGATASFKHVGIPHATIPKTGVAVSRIGFGGYRINNSTAEHKLALLEAVKSGVNVIDTSAHFENGASEELIGEALKDLFVNNFIKREQLVLISKAGYLQRSDTKDFVASDYVQINDKHFHSLSPAVLDAHITRSLRRMGIDQLDVFMLNSPERMLLAKNKPFTKSDVYASISLAIRHLDTEVAQGRIGGYGICSNSMSNPLAPDHISLATILDDLGHGRADNFVAVQAPFNLFERGVVGGDVYEDGVAAAGDPLAKIAAV